VLKLKKYFVFGLLMAVVSMFAVSCDDGTEDPEDPTVYKVTIEGGTITGGKTSFEKGETVTITASNPARFLYWTASPASANVVFADDEAVTTTFVMPDRAVTIKAVEEYKVSVVNGELLDFDSQDYLGTTGHYEAGDVILVEADDLSADGKKFSHWTATPASANVVFYDDEAERTTFIMPGRDVTITAVFDDGGEPMYTVNIVGGTMKWLDDDGEYYDLEDGGKLFELDIVLVLAATPVEGKVFSHWEASVTGGEFYDEEAEETTYRMPAKNVVITAVFRELADGEADIRFAWVSAEQDKVEYIYASEEDIEWWYENVYDDLKIDDEDFVIRPSFVDGTPGIAGLPTIFQIDEAAQLPHPNNGKYHYDVPAGSYIAVCSVNDPYTPEIIWEIVADYTITVNGATATADGEDKRFEIGFDLTRFLEDESEWGWYGVEPAIGSNPIVSKRKAGKKVFTNKVVKGGATMDVTYYAFPRAKK